MALVNSAPSLVILNDTEFRYTFINRHLRAATATRPWRTCTARGDEVIMRPEFVAQVRADELR